MLIIKKKLKYKYATSGFNFSDSKFYNCPGDVFWIGMEIIICDKYFYIALVGPRCKDM